MAAARKPPANAPAPAAAPADDAARPSAAPAPDTPPESEAAPGAATSATPGGAGAPPVQFAAASGYVALRRIRYGTKDAEGQRISRTYEPGAALDLDNDTAAVLLQSGDVRRA